MGNFIYYLVSPKHVYGCTIQQNAVNVVKKNYFVSLQMMLQYPGNKDQHKDSRLKIICMYEHIHSIICNKLGKKMPTFGFELNINMQAGTCVITRYSWTVKSFFSSTTSLLLKKLLTPIKNAMSFIELPSRGRL